mmetsp:Transcript_2377/g.7275  ORF Transcript_2377/g.7275 Transcript_2377/m.7275 type:complete len:217 (-) Transcript_2377:2165-2815(-)
MPVFLQDSQSAHRDVFDRPADCSFHPRLQPLFHRWVRSRRWLVLPSYSCCLDRITQSASCTCPPLVSAAWPQPCSLLPLQPSADKSRSPSWGSSVPPWRTQRGRGTWTGCRRTGSSSQGSGSALTMQNFTTTWLMSLAKEWQRGARKLRSMRGAGACMRKLSLWLQTSERLSGPSQPSTRRPMSRSQWSSCNKLSRSTPTARGLTRTLVICWLGRS